MGMDVEPVVAAAVDDLEPCKFGAFVEWPEVVENYQLVPSELHVVVVEVATVDDFPSDFWRAQHSLAVQQQPRQA